MNYRLIRNDLIQIMVDYGDIICRGDGLYEDMGGHILHESNLDGHIKSFLDGLHPTEREEIIESLRQ